MKFDLLPFCAARGIPVMAYSPVGQGGGLLRHAALRAVAARRGITLAQVALAFVLARPGVIAIPKASDPVHLRANAAARDVVLAPEDLASSMPPSRRRGASGGSR